jgi:hypothetical protein
MIRWGIIVVTVVAAFGAGRFLSVAFWDNAKPGMLVALSVIAAGVLVRLARGVPFNSPDQYEVEEARQLVNAVKQTMGALRALLFVVLVGMISLVAAKPTLDAIAGIDGAQLHLLYVEFTASAWIGALLTYAFVRIAQVVNGDRDVTNLQAKFLVRAVERRQARMFAELETKSADIGFENPEGYGKVVQ